MKKLRISVSLLALISLLLCVWPVQQYMSEGSDIIQAGLNLIYFFSLFTGFLSFRLALPFINKKNLIICILPLILIALSTYTWLFPTEFLVVGKYMLGLLPWIIASLLMLFVRNKSNISVVLQVLIFISAGSLSFCAYLGVSTPFVYTVLIVILSIVTIATLAHLIFAKSN